MSVYAFGSNGNGQLGLGHHDDVSSPEVCLFSESTHSLPVKAVGGGNFTCLLLKDGQIVVAGKLPFVNDGVQSAESKFRPVRLPNQVKAKFCAASWEALFIVTEDNEVLVCGAGSKGELGQGQDIHEAGTFMQIDDFPPKDCEIVQISSGVYHTVVVLSNGEAYGWGNGRKEQLGLPSATVWKPRRIDGLGFTIHGVACGKDFTVLIGDPTAGEVKAIGLDKWSIRSNAPSAIPKWNQLGANWGGAMVLLDGGEVKSWGRDDRGQLGRAEGSNIVLAALGSEHTLLLTSQGRLTCHGWGEHGNCGPHVDESGNAITNSAPITLPWFSKDRPIEGIGAGCATSFIWTVDS